jgi:hypothetical protein
MKKLLFLLPALALAACGSETSGTFEGDEGEEGSYTVDHESGETDISIQTEEGELSIKSGANLGVDLPDGFTLYPGVEVVSNTTATQGDGQGAMVVMTSEDEPEELVEHYRKQAVAAGVTIETELKTAQGIMIGGEGDGTTFTFNAGTQDGKTSAQLFVSRGIGS